MGGHSRNVCKIGMGGRTSDVCKNGIQVLYLQPLTSMEVGVQRMEVGVQRMEVVHMLKPCTEWCREPGSALVGDACNTYRHGWYDKVWCGCVCFIIGCSLHAPKFRVC